MLTGAQGRGGAFRGLLRFLGAGEGSVFLPEMRGMGVESEDGEGSERAVLKRRRRRAMGVWARQEASRAEAAVIHMQGIRRERRGRGVLLDGTSGAGTWQPLCAAKQPHL